MINNSYFYYNKNTDNPYDTLALEEAILENLKDDEIILYLYVHRPSVIIGKNQNAWKECRVSELERDGGILARRISGGGAVYHDKGNLNFSFITNNNDYDTSRQLSVIAQAVSAYDIHAEVSGRNDILANGRKFSGNAFCFKKGKAFHHGTILINVDTANLTRYLSVSEDKIKSKGIDSVRSRICNLTEFNERVTVESIAETLKESFFREYGNGSDYVPDNQVIANAGVISERNSSWDWKFGYQGNFDIEMRKRFTWGDADICLKLKDAVIISAVIYSDAMDAEYIDLISRILTGRHFAANELAAGLQESALTEEQYIIAKDITDFIYEKTSR